MGTPNTVAQEEVIVEKKLILTAGVVAFDFTFAENAPTDEIKVLFVKNKKSHDKPGGRGLPKGQVDQKEDIQHAAGRETRDESGYPVIRYIGKLTVIPKPWIPNEIHLFLVEPSDVCLGTREKDEIDYSVDPWLSLREIFTMPLAQARDGSDKNPNGIYFSDRKRLFDVIYRMLFRSDLLVDGDKISGWLTPVNRRLLGKAMETLEKEGLLSEFHDDDE